jgi:hypothetical protein
MLLGLFFYENDLLINTYRKTPRAQKLNSSSHYEYS